jgi:hypothetical protein
MTPNINSDLFKNNIDAVLDETINDVKGIYLDRGTSIKETLSAVSSEEASRPTVEGGTTIAGHADHIRFYLRALNDYMDGKEIGKLDWSRSWLRKDVTDSEWDDLRKQLADDLQKTRSRIAEITDWNDDKRLGGALAIVAHTAFHLGAIRQMLLVIKQRG